MVKIIVATIMRPTGDTGVQTHFCSFIRWMEISGYPVSIVTPYSAPRWLVYPVFAARRILNGLSGLASVWWYRYWHKLFLEVALKSRLASGDECIIYAQCPLSASAAMRARKNSQQRIVLVVHFNVSQADEWADKGMISSHGGYAESIRQFEVQTFAQLDGVVFVSEFMRMALLERIPSISGVPYAVIPNFVSDPGFPNKSSTFDADLLIVGTLEPRKNQAYALEIVAAAAKLGTKLSLTVAGDGPDRTKLELLVKTLGIADQVHFLGFVRNAASLFSRHRACLHTARIENLPLTLIEALSRGVPVFAPNVGGVPEVFTDNVEGRYLPLDAPDAAGLILLEWFSEGGHRLEDARSKARAKFLTHFESDVAARQLYTFLLDTGQK